jgi:hypothetical protein
VLRFHSSFIGYESIALIVAPRTGRAAAPEPRDRLRPIEIDRSTRKVLISESLRVGPEGGDGWRPVTYGNEEVGLLRRLDSGHWRLDVKLAHWEEWHENTTQLVTLSPEMAEAWAMDEVATYIAMTEEVRERDNS